MLWQRDGCCRSENSYDQRLGYSTVDVASVPEGSNLGLGCGNPMAIASIRPGETILDLGSGAGFDCFLAARQLNSTGRVIGVDMTPAMIAKARNNVRKGQYTNVEFRLGEIEALPIADNFVDLVISNCVINLSPEKPRVFSGSVPGPQSGWPACPRGCSRHQTITGEHSNAVERDRSMYRRGSFS